MATDKSLTVTEWLDRFMDLETYLANGGSLLDLPIDALDTVPPDMVHSLVKRMGQERQKHLGGSRDRPAERAAATAPEPPAEPQAPAAEDAARRELH